MNTRLFAVLLAIAPAACGTSSTGTPDAGADVGLRIDAVVRDGDTAQVAAEPLKFTVMTFNAGTSSGQLHSKDEAEGNGDGYTDEHAQEVDAHYGNSLSWNPAEAKTIEFLADLKPEIVAFQEIFHDPWCEDIEAKPELDLVCNDYSPDRPYQMERLLGDDYQIACNLDAEDRCAAVRKDFGRFVGCPLDEVCFGGIRGPGLGDIGCSEAARIGSIEIELIDGRLLVLVNAHANAGMKDSNMECRKHQFQQIFLDRGDGKPAAFGEANLIMGDLNTDPFVLAATDPSAAELNKYVGEGKPFHYISSDSAEGPPTHVTTMRIDHVISDVIGGSCVVAGESPGVEPIMETTVFDHRPVICEVEF